MHRCGGGSVVSRLRNLFTLSKGRADIQKPAWFFKRIRTKISDPISTRANSPEAIPDVEPVELTIAAQLTRDESSRRYKAGEVIIRENDVGETAYVIAQGQVEVSKGLDGQNVDLAYLGAGEIFGEMSMIDEKPRSATVTAITETLVSEIGRDDFFNSFQTDPKVALQLLQVLFERLRESDARILVGHLQRSLLTARVAAHAAEVEHEQRLLAEIKQRDAEQAKDKVTNILDELKRFNEELERRSLKGRSSCSKPMQRSSVTWSNEKSSRISLYRHRRWKASAHWQAALPMTLIIYSTLFRDMLSYCADTVSRTRRWSKVLLPSTTPFNADLPSSINY